MAILVVWIFRLRFPVALASMVTNAIPVSLAGLAGLAAQFCFAAVAAGSAQPSESRSRTHCSRSGAHVVATPATGVEVLPTMPVTMVAVEGAHPSAGIEHRLGQDERQLPYGLTDPCRPSTDIRALEFVARKPPVRSNRHTRRWSRSGAHT